ncbi:MAG: hypothetical protein KO206_09555 [Methanomicrobiaceae archaeon]|uniref:Uncharacterized protein n=1 Tax=hydrocarbon metagenome TaxID=938273 RepID=A0A0W8FJC2_9ZZZZ|nr:hypothetical protein [Methanomicrobiaceae archaeon]MDD5419189.1 hypothetical protein [Methanomicrobiaceae archaeon]
MDFLSEIKMGAPLRAGERLLIPISRIVKLQHPGMFAGYASPVAFVVLEGEDEYLVPLAPDADPDKIREEIASLEEELEGERRKYRAGGGTPA